MEGMPPRNPRRPAPPRGQAWRPRRATLVAVAAAVLALAGGSRQLTAAPYGVNAHVPGPEVLDAIAASGIGWVRIDLVWAWVEPEQDRFDWGVYDALVDAAIARGLRIYATIATTPAWATDGPAGTGVPRDAKDWYDVCYRAAARYRGRIDYWGMWNEPNLARFWSGGRSDYITLILKTGSRAVRAANPRARVCGPELAHLQGAAWDTWLRDVLAQASDSLDVVTHHIYPVGADAGSVVRELTEGSRYPWEPPSVRRVLDDAGWLGRPFWLTETGVEARFGDASGEEEQASFVRNLLFDLLSPNRSVTWVDKVFFYEMTDSNFALLGPRPALQPRPSYAAYRSFITVNLVDDAEVVDATIPPRLAPGASATVVLSLRNAGTTTWSGEDGYRLVPRTDAVLFGVPTEGIPPPTDTPPGAVAVFTFAVKAPAAGSDAPLELAWRMERQADDGFGEEVRRAVTVSDTAAPVVSYLPSLANAGGLNGTRWRSDVTLYNGSPDPAVVRLELLEAGQDNTFPRVATISLSPRSSQWISNVLETLFGRTGTAALRVVSESGDVRASARTYTLLAAGTSGQYIPAIPEAAAAPAGRGVELIGLARSADPAIGYRTNLGLVNPSAAAASVEVDLFRAGSTFIGTLAYDLPAFGFLQVTDIFHEAGAPEANGGRAVVRATTPGGKVLAYGSRVDNRSGDPSYLASFEPLAEPAVIAAAAHNLGFNGSLWRTDVELFNPGRTPLTCSLAFEVNAVPSGGSSATTRSVVLAPGELKSFGDVVGTLFGVEGSGALVVTPSGGSVLVGSRTYNLTARGTFGQFVPAVAVSRAAVSGDEIHLAALAGSQDRSRGFRTNLGLLNLSALPVTFVITLSKAPQGVVGQLEPTLAPHEWRQLDDVFARVSSPPAAGFARVGVTTPGARFLAYASVVDNVTGDPALVPGW
ncbi:MAG: DUF5719 family protein [Acidobacteriota bacterium]